MRVEIAAHEVPAGTGLFYFPSTFRMKSLVALVSLRRFLFFGLLDDLFPISNYRTTRQIVRRSRFKLHRYPNPHWVCQVHNSEIKAGGIKHEEGS